MYLDNSIGITGKSLIIAFIIVNVFNIFPLKIYDFSWAILVFSLIVDSSSLLITGILILKVRNNIRIEALKAKELAQYSEKLIQEEFWGKNYKLINKFICYFYILIIIFQGPILINGITTIDLNNRFRIERIEKEFDKLKNSLKINENQTKIELSIEDSLKSLNNKKKVNLNLIKETKKSQLTNLIKSSIKIILLSMLWAYAFFRMSLI